MLTLGGSVATTAIPPSFVALQDPGLTKQQHDPNALAAYYNTTLTYIGRTNFANASFLLQTFHFVNISPSVNATARLANADLGTVNSSAANATAAFDQAVLDIKARQFLNATVLVNQGCAFAQRANSSLADFQGPQTKAFKSESVPVTQYSKGSALADLEVKALLARCNDLLGQVNFSGLVLLIGSSQTSIETGGQVSLNGNLTLHGTGIGNEDVLFYINGTYFGSLTTQSNGDLGGTLRIPFLYSHFAVVQAVVVPDTGLKLGGATSNTLLFLILFNQTAIVIGDPPAILPTFSFNVEGNLRTVSGTALPNAPVQITFLGDSKLVRTNSLGVFATRLTVPANASDGIYNVYARFAPQGVLGPSFNFTQVEVYHLALNLTLSAPQISWAGFATHVDGIATSNGSRVANVAITLNSPWGSTATQTDSTGRFTADIVVSPFELALEKGASVTAVPSQPYITSASATIGLRLFNVFALAILVAAVGIGGWEADKLGVFEGARKMLGRKQATEVTAARAVIPQDAILQIRSGPEALQLYWRALQLAAGKLGLRFAPSQTIRETLAAVATKADSDSSAEFSAVLLTAEDFLYAESFDQSRLADARRHLESLEERWK
jgi:hypothetical protein